MKENRLKQIKTKPIKNCRSCGSKKLEDILSLGNFYIAGFAESRNKVHRYPLTLVLCRVCGLLQLKHTAPQSVLYTNTYGYKSGISGIMRDELKGIVRESLHKIILRPFDKAQGSGQEAPLRSEASKSQKFIVVDIGANDGTLLSYYPKNVFRVAVEPIKKYAHASQKHAEVVINDFFNFKSYVKKMKNKKAHLITAIACFYDIDNPNRFLSDIIKILHERGVFVIQQNYLVDMLKNNAFCNVVHEHLEYYSLLSLDRLLNKHGLEIFDVALSPINGGSFRTYIGRIGRREVGNSVLKLRESELRQALDKKETYQDFAARIRIVSRQIRNFIRKKVKQGKIVMVYGASTRGNTLLQYSRLDNRLIKAAVERNPEKHGKKIVSVGIPIISEERARLEKPDYMLVLPWFFKEEFLKREKDYLKNGGHFIFPLPKLEVV